MRAEVQSLVMPCPDAHGAGPAANAEPVSWSAIRRIATKINPASVLCVGPESGWYARQLASDGRQVVAFNRDEQAIGRLYEQARRENLSLLPLVMPFVKPTPRM